MSELIRRIEWPGAAASQDDSYLEQEWLVTNGLGGYASGTVAGVLTRRFHGVLIAALPSPYGRRMMLNALAERLVFPDGKELDIGGEETVNSALFRHAADYLEEFRLESGLPVWRYRVGEVVLEKRLLMIHRQNTVHIGYRLLSGPSPLTLQLRPAIQFRPHEGTLGSLPSQDYNTTVVNDRYEFSPGAESPVLRVRMYGENSGFTFDRRIIQEVLYRIEESRGYEGKGPLWSPGYWCAQLSAGKDATLVASTEPWQIINAISPEQAYRIEGQRRALLIAQSPQAAHEGVGAELVLAADQFLFTPVGRVEDMARARAAGDEVRSVIAGYHWFTDWGRDTMISLEGLTLCTGREQEAAWILRTFAYYVRNGLIPNMFPEGENEGLYHTADASLWFFHAVNRYLRQTGDYALLRAILPKLQEIVDAHLAGTRFGIHVDPQDELLHQGAPGYQLTWMDAKVGDWVVTPRRGKAVEINALWYNALSLFAGWLEQLEGSEASQPYRDHVARTRESFNRRFWNDRLGYLYDVLDTEEGRDDDACRPNQLFAISLDHPVLEEQHWRAVVEVCREQLVTPVGLRSLAPGHPDYKDKYFGDLRSRDAAYHQGTVWGWLIGPFVEAYLKVYPNDLAGARKFLSGFEVHLNHACIGSISEVFDATPPFAPRACIAQAWSVAEVLRCWVRTAGGDGRAPALVTEELIPAGQK